jgi:signal transduction histidine kinase
VEARLRLAVLLLVGATVLLGCLAFTALTVRDRTATLDTASKDMEQLVMLMAEQVRSAIDTDRVVLGRMEQLVLSQGIDHLRGSRRDQQRLLRIMTDAPSVQSLLIIGPDGRLAIASHDPPPGDSLDRSDRDYVTQVVPPAPRRDFISPLIRGRMTGRFIFAVSRRVEDESGRFVGIVQSSIDVDYFLSLYRRLATDPAQTFAIYKTDGAMVLRHPLPADEGAAAGNAPFVELVKAAPAGTYISPSVFDGIERLHAYRSIPERGLVVTTSLPVDAVLVGWRHRTVNNAGLMAAALVVLLTLAGWAWQVAKRAELARWREIQANRSKSTFFASASHDLRQPMQAMRLFWTLIHDQVHDIGNKSLCQSVVRLGTAMQASEDLLNSLLDVATLEAGSTVPRVQAFDIAEIIDSEADSFGKLAESRSLRLRTVPFHARVLSDPVLLRRILRNLIVNAIKFTDRGGVLVGCRRRNGAVLLQVWDSGKGIAETELAAIFDDFYQVGNSARLRSEGLGLGLSVVSRTARLLDHPVRVRSRPGRGSLFEVEIAATE